MSHQAGKINRRGLLQLVPSTLISASVASAHQNCSVHAPDSANTAPAYKLQFFTEQEARLLDAVMEKIIPADEHSPGAHEARVVEFADLMVATGPEYAKTDWRNALHLLGEEMRTSNLDAWLAAAAEREQDPQTVLEVFFRTLKHTTINGYYTSRIGIHDELRYEGNTYLSAFPGCDHPEHQG